MNYNKNIKEVDCALIFMLNEEKELFLKNNNDFIITSDQSNEFIEFIFFDKNMCKRTGVIYSDGFNMGNTEACLLLYKLSRNYKAHLYINLGVAGLISDLNIGDVLIPNRLSTMCENNANNTHEKELKDLFDNNSLAESAVNQLNHIDNLFGDDNVNEVANFINELKEKIELNQYKGINEFKKNIIRTGWCSTVPEVIKERTSEYIKRKLNIVDMEAYYFGRWIEILKEYEPNNVINSSDFITFKSVSDYGDDNKNIMEKCGSRNLAMKNLATSVCVYCTEIYDFRRETDEDLYSYFTKVICKKSLDEFINKFPDINSDIFDNFFKHIVYTNQTPSFDINSCTSSSIKILNSNNQALLLTGRSGAGKSTLMSYIYKKVSKDRDAIIIDFSNFSNATSPTDDQLLKLIKKLIKQKNEMYIFLDGLDKNKKAYDFFKTLFNNFSHSYLSFCIGNVRGESYGDLYDAISTNSSITELVFYGVSIYSDNFKKFIEDGCLFFEMTNIEQVINFIQESNVSNVDFRLLSIISNCSRKVTMPKSLYDVIKNYVNSKYKIDSLNAYFEYHLGEKSHLEKYNKYNKIFQKIYRNSYSNAWATAYGIINVFIDNDTDKIKRLFNQKYLLSNDMNLMFEHLLKSKRQKSKIIMNMFNSLKEFEANISVETQLLYNICCATKCNANYYKQIEQYVILKISKAKNEVEKHNDSEEYTNWIIKYRTLCVILYLNFKNDSYLKTFTDMLLEEKNVSQYNLLFHLFYYSRREFFFEDLYNYDFDDVDYEMFSNTYYTLIHSLNPNNESIFTTNIIQKNPFTIMNLITIHLIKYIILDNMKFSDYAIEAQKNINIFISTINLAYERLNSPEEYQKIMCLGKEVLDNLDNLQS